MTPIRPISFAASLRLVLGLIALLLLPEVYPGLKDFRWVFGAYVGWSAIAQVLIWRRLGGSARTVFDGLVDLAVLTFLVHRVGSVANMMTSVYMVAVVLNVLVVGRRMGTFVAVAGSLAYSGVVVLEAVGVLPYAPDAPPWALGTQPSLTQALVAAGLTSMIMLLMAGMVGMLVRMIKVREAQLVEANVQLEELSQRDPLTQLFNRRHLLRRIQEELAWVARGRPMAVVMLDLDRFKRVNDRRGHVEGDALLRQLADAMARSSRATDVAGRFGGDEFLILLPDTLPDQGAVAAERLRQAVADTGRAFDAELAVTASVGVAYGRGTDSPDELIRRADANAYRAKQQGGDTIVAGDETHSMHPRAPGDPDDARTSIPPGEPDPCAS
jgi:diguanylate cyclase (GGDEF)-like protein